MNEDEDRAIDEANRWTIYRRKDKKWAWRLTMNGNVIATDHSQGYENREDCEEMVKQIRNGDYKDLDLVYYGTKEDLAGL